jgi:quercetin dioxygenase-like cupin family protein
VGDEHGGVGVSLLLIEAAPGQGPSLHTHPYAEIHIAQDGEALFAAGDEQRLVRAGEIVLVPAGVPHAFTAGDAGFSETAVHVNGHFITEWLADES